MRGKKTKSGVDKAFQRFDHEREQGNGVQAGGEFEGRKGFFLKRGRDRSTLGFW